MRNLKFIIFIFIISFFNIKPVDASGISLSDYVDIINSNNYGEFYLLQISEYYTDIFVNSLATTYDGTIRLDGTMAEISDPDDYIEEYITGTLEGNILSFYIDLSYLQPTSFNSNNKTQLIQPLIITDESFNKVKQLNFKDDAGYVYYGIIKYIMTLSVLDAYGQYKGYQKGEFVHVESPFYYEGKGFNLEDEGVVITETSQYNIYFYSNYFIFSVLPS